LTVKEKNWKKEIGFHYEISFGANIFRPFYISLTL